MELVDVATLYRYTGPISPGPDDYDWLRLLAYVRTQSQIGWVAVPAANRFAAIECRSMLDKWVSHFPLWRNVSTAATCGGDGNAAMFRNGPYATCHRNECGARAKTRMAVDGKSSAIRHGIPSRTEERMR